MPGASINSQSEPGNISTAAMTKLTALQMQTNPASSAAKTEWALRRRIGDDSDDSNDGLPNSREPASPLENVRKAIKFTKCVKLFLYFSFVTF